MSSNITLLSSAFFTTETMMNNKSSPYLSLSSTLLLIIIAHYKQHDSFANAEPSMIKPLHNIWVSRNVTECNHEKRLRFPLCNHRFLEILSYHLVTFKSQSGCHFYMSGFQNQLEHESSIFVYVLLATKYCCQGIFPLAYFLSGEYSSASVLSNRFDIYSICTRKFLRLLLITIHKHHNSNCTIS